MALILLLEDDDVLARQIKAFLELDGHEVQVFQYATDAIAFLDMHPVNLIIADLFIRVDGKYVQDGGIKLISYTRQIAARKIPIIAISGAFNAAHGAYASSSSITVGATANLAKPFHPDELSHLVKQQLNLPWGS